LRRQDQEHQQNAQREYEYRRVGCGLLLEGEFRPLEAIAVGRALASTRSMAEVACPEE